MKRSEQGGAIVGFLIASAVLALLLIGGAYAVRHYPNWVAKHDTAPATHRDATDEAPASSEKSDSAKDEAAQTNDATQPTADSSSSADNSTAPSSGDSAVAPIMDNSTQSSAPALPHTGPADTMASIVAVGSLVAATAAYLRSRQLSEIQGSF